MKEYLNKTFYNIQRLIKFIIRRERVISIIWLLSFVIFSIIIAGAYTQLFTSEEERMVMVVTMQNPMMIALMGPPYALNNFTTGVMFASELLLMTALVVVLMNIFFVTRHTRSDEEAGRVEVIRSLPVGRSANLGATLMTAFILNFILAILMGLGLIILNIESMNAAGSFAYGAALGVVGFFFAAVTAVFAQLSHNPRGTIGYSIIFMFICYLTRAYGDIKDNFLSYISPFGLIIKTEVYHLNKIWPLIVVFIFSLPLILLAFYLNAKRDLGQGIISAKKGKEKANFMLKSSFGFTFSLLKNSIIVWAISLVIFGAMYGSVMGDMDTYIGNIDIFKDLLQGTQGYSAVEMFLSILMSVLAMFATIPILSVVFKLANEEKAGRVEVILSKPLSRNKQFTNYLIITLIISILMPFLSIFGLWGASYLVVDPAPSFISLFKAMMVYLPAIWMLIGIAFLVIGLAPKYTNVVWIYLGFSFFAVYLGSLLKLSDWFVKLSPFGWIPQLPIDSINWWVLIIIILISTGLILLGYIFYNKRDIKRS